MFWDSMTDMETYQQSSRSHSSMESKECSPVKLREVTLYDNSPSRMSCDGSPDCSFTMRRPSLDLLQDNSTQDSGYSPSETNKISPRRQLSFGSMSEDFIDLSDIENDAENQPPAGTRMSEFAKLITGDISDHLNTSSPKCSVSRPPLRKAFSLIGNSNTTPVPRVRSCLFEKLSAASPTETSRSFKRPEPPTEMISPLSVKRCKLFDRPVRRVVEARSIFKRSISNQEDIKSAIHRSSTEKNLVGDYTKTFCLPLIPGRHQDLKSITPTTVANLMKGDYNDKVSSYKIIDCRYPYEYEGGHIQGAKNLYTKEQILKELLQDNKPEEQEENKRNILIFHCEFSSERAPNLSRFLRSSDRNENKDYFPYLSFPEIYLLDGGYKNFYETHSELCAPNDYLPMLHPDHEQNLKHFRAKSRTFNADIKAAKSKSKHRL